MSLCPLFCPNCNAKLTWKETEVVFLGHCWKPLKNGNRFEHEYFISFHKETNLLHCLSYTEFPWKFHWTNNRLEFVELDESHPSYDYDEFLVLSHPTPSIQKILNPKTLFDYLIFI